MITAAQARQLRLLIEARVGNPDGRVPCVNLNEFIDQITEGNAPAANPLAALDESRPSGPLAPHRYRKGGGRGGRRLA